MKRNRPAEPERHDPNVGRSAPGESLWGIDKPYVGPPESGQPRHQRGPAAAPTADAQKSKRKPK